MINTVYTELASYIIIVLKATTFVSSVLPTLTLLLNAVSVSIITTRVIPYTFPSKPSEEPFPCVYFSAYSYLPGCCPRNSLTPLRIYVSLLRLVRYHFSGHVICISQELNSRQNGEFHGHCVESLLGSLVLSSVHSTIIIITNALINQARIYYVITNFYLIWDRSQCLSLV